MDQCEREFIEKDVENTRMGIALALEGEWQVPPERRPKGWEGMRLREPSPPSIDSLEGSPAPSSAILEGK